MLPGQASQTLLIASIMRARHQLFDAPVVLDDPVVLKLVPEAQDPGVLTEFGESRASMASLMRSMFAVRSRFTEDRLARAAARVSTSCSVLVLIPFLGGSPTLRKTCRFSQSITQRV